MSDDLIHMIEKRYNVDIFKTILPNVANKLIKDLVTFRINNNFIQMFEINMHYEIKIIFEMLQ